jgi:hypothetical protein
MGGEHEVRPYGDGRRWAALGGAERRQRGWQMAKTTLDIRQVMVLLFVETN